MRLFFLCQIVFFSLFSIQIEHIEDIDKHKHLASQKNFNGVGVVVADGMMGTGTLIHPDVVITAAHVVQHSAKIEFLIFENEKYRTVQGTYICHPEYVGGVLPKISRDDMEVDIALIFLESPISEISFPVLAEIEPDSFEQLYATGFGEWNEDGPARAIHRKLTGTVSLQECIRHLLIIPCENEKNIDLFGTGRPGDSGGPLMSITGRDTIHGILSCMMYATGDGEDSSERGDPTYTIYPAVYAHIEWILETIQEHYDHI